MARPEPPEGWAYEPTGNYGCRERWGPYHRQAGRFVGRTLERLGAWLESWSWRWHG